MNHLQRPSREIIAVLERLNWPPISPTHSINANSRIVHDLGIIGDDWDSFYEVLRNVYGKDFVVPAPNMPGEISHDSAMVASAGGWLARWLPAIQNWYISRIRCNPLTLKDLHDLIVAF